MSELKPCKCGKMPEVYHDSENLLFGVGIGCTNIFCDQSLLIRYGFTKEQAERRARKAWNRRSK